jgi:hypothetical protein
MKAVVVRKWRILQLLDLMVTVESGEGLGSQDGSSFDDGLSNRLTVFFM